MRRRVASRWTAAAIAALVAAAGLPAPGALAVTQVGLQAEGIDTPAGEPQPAFDPLQVGQQPFDLAVSRGLGACPGSRAARAAPTDAGPIQFSDCDILYVADPVNYVVRGLASFGSGVQGAAVAFGERVLFGNGGRGTEGDGGPAGDAQLSGPYAVDPDPASGRVYVADAFANQVRRVDERGTILRVAGLQSGAFGFSGDGGDATAAGLASPFGVARGSAVTYVADTLDNRVREIDDRTGAIRTVVGTGEAGYSGDGRQGTSARLSRPRGLAFVAGELLIADTGNSVVRRWDPGTGVVTTVAGDGTAGFAGDGGPATGAELDEPSAVAVDPASGTLYIADTDNNRIRGVSGGLIDTFAGTGAAGFSGDGGPAVQARLSSPFAVAVLSTGAVVIGDTGNGRVRVVEGPRDPGPGDIATLAGDGTPSHAGGAGAALDQLSGPTAVTSSSSLGSLGAQLCPGSGPGAILLVLDTFNHRLGAQCPATSGVLRDVIGDGVPGTSPGLGRIGAPGAGPARLSYPMGLAVGGAPRALVYVSDTFNNVVRVIDTSPAGPVVRTVAGTGTAGFSGDGLPATQAQLNHPGGLAVDRDGSLYIADTYNDRIRRVDASGTISTVAGTGVSGSGGDGGPATAATLFFPEGVAVDAARPANVYVADTFSHRIRRIDGATQVIDGFAGTGQEGFADGPARTAARFDRPWGVSVDSTPGPVGPVVYVADEANHRVRFVAGGAVSTLTIPAGSRGLRGDLGPVGSAEVDRPRGVTALDGAGTLLVADSFNDRVRRTCAPALLAADLAFPPTRTGTIAVLSTRLTNAGCAVASPTGITVQGAAFAPGGVGPGETPCRAGVALAPGGSCSIGVAFTPPVPDPDPGQPEVVTGSLTVVDGAGSTTAGLTGAGVQPALLLEEGSQPLGLLCSVGASPPPCSLELPLAFGTEPNQTATLTIANPGTAPLRASQIHVTTVAGGASFTLAPSAADPCTPLRAPSASAATWPDTTVPPGGFCNVDIDYSVGVATAALVITTDDGPAGTANHAVVTLSGTAAPPIA